MSGGPPVLGEDVGGPGRLARLAPAELLGLLHGRRWFRALEHPAASARVSAVVHADDALELSLVDVGFTDGEHGLYLVALGADGGDAMADLAALRRLTQLAGVDTPCLAVRAAGVEQSNSAVVLDESVVLKLYRHIEPGPGIEAELLHGLQEAGFASSPRLRGVLDDERSGRRTTLAIVTDYVASAGDGWELTLSSLSSGDTGWLPSRARRLGEVTGAMHAALASAADPVLAPEEPAAGALDELAAELETDLAALAATPLEAMVAPLRERTRALRESAAVPRLALRIHGDYHLGQALWADRGDWVVIDMEGEPARPIPERRRRTFALRDVAGMVRSFAYAASASSLHGGVPVPEGWEASCRAAFLEGWRATVDPRLVPAGEQGFESLLALCELRKLLYELRYELSHRPDWVAIPAAGLERILQGT
jgi:predicted trehalose synthase